MTGARDIYVAVVDDDEGIRRSFGRLLRAAHFHPITYASAEEFLTDTQHPKFDCLVLDIQLGGMSGLELKKKLSVVKDDTPVVFITAHDDPEVCAIAEQCGHAGFFRKTDSGADVLASIRRATNMARRNRES